LPALLPTLRSVANVGVFYFRTYHGSASFGPNDSTNTDALWTASPALDSAAEASDPFLPDDLKAHRVVYMLYRSGAWQAATPGLEPSRHYGITPSFVRTYMSSALSENSLVYIDASGTGNPGIWFPNASLGIGWQGSVAFDAAGRTASYVFDRLLGANVFAPENPKQRAFSYNALRADPKFGHGQLFGYSFYPLNVGAAAAEADLAMVPVKGQFALLAPGIMQVSADETQNFVIINGDFGPDPGPPDGKVTIDDGTGEIALAIFSWNPNEIKATLRQMGQGSAGNVVVIVRGHRSNARQLIAWQGTFTYTLKDAGSLTQTWQLDLRGRVDPQEIRVAPGQQPVSFAIAYTSMSDGFLARYSANGSATVANSSSGCTVVTRWQSTGSGTVASKFPPVSLTSYGSEGTVDLKRRVWELSFDAAAENALSEDMTATCKSTTSHSINQRDMLAQPWEATLHGDAGINLALDDGLNAQASRRDSSAVSAIDPSARRAISITWQNILARPRFDPSLAR
jgi:hypothetical protein